MRPSLYEATWLHSLTEPVFSDTISVIMIGWFVALSLALIYTRVQLRQAIAVMGCAGKAGPAPDKEVMMDKLGMERPDGTAGERGREPRHAKDAESSPDDGGDLSAAPAGAEVGSSGTFADLCADDGGNGGDKGKGAASGGNNSGKDGG